MTKAKDTRFVMRLRGPKDEMFALVDRLATLGVGVDIEIRPTKTHARIVARVPQEQARAAMALAGLP